MSAAACLRGAQLRQHVCRQQFFESPQVLKRFMVSSMDSLLTIVGQAHGFLLGAVSSLNLSAGALCWPSSRLAPWDMAVSASRFRLVVFTSESEEREDVQLRARTRRGDVGVVDSSEENEERLVAVLSDLLSDWPSRAGEMRSSYRDLRWNRCPSPSPPGSLVRRYNRPSDAYPVEGGSRRTDVPTPHLMKCLPILHTPGTPCTST